MRKDISIPIDVLAKFDGKANYYYLFACILDNVNRKGICDLSIRSLSAVSNLSVKVVRNAIDFMVKKKLIKLSSQETRGAQQRAQQNTIISICNTSEYSITFFEKGTVKGTVFTFEKLWDLYKKKEGPKDRLRKKWNTFDEETKEKVFKFVPKYVALTEYKYRKMLSTFLNQRTWENETISVGYDSINVKNFNASLLVDGENSLFYQFVDHFNKFVAGTKIPSVDMKTGLTEERRVKFNIAYCLKYHQIKLVMEKVLASPSLNGEKGFVASYDFIFDQKNFQKIYEGVYDR